MQAVVDFLVRDCIQVQTLIFLNNDKIVQAFGIIVKGKFGVRRDI
jgi:hypothetical protein